MYACKAVALNTKGVDPHVTWLNTKKCDRSGTGSTFKIRVKNDKDGANEMIPVSEFARIKKNDITCITQLLTSLSLNTINTPSQRSAMYGNYVTLWLELKTTGKLRHMEIKKERKWNRGRKGKIIKQALKQYSTLQMLRSVILPNREFMRIVMINDSHFDLSNTFLWVDIAFVRKTVMTLEQQLRFVGMAHEHVIFEHKIQTPLFTGVCDVYDPTTQTVLEVKTCRFIPKEAFVQVSLTPFALANHPVIPFGCTTKQLASVYSPHKCSP